MILRFTLLLLVTCILTLSGQNEDCPLAFDLVEETTALEGLVFRIQASQMTNAGADDAINDLSCQLPFDYDINDAIRQQITNFPTPITRADSVELEGLYDLIRDVTTDPWTYPFPEGKSFWFSFNVIEAGSFEMIITPDEVDEAIGGNFDFLIIEGNCPSDPCAETVFCGFDGPSACFNENVALTTGVFEPSVYFPTGLADNPLLDYQVGQSQDFPEIWESIQLEAGKNYYVLIDHTLPDRSNLGPSLGFDACAYPDLGCSIQFGGTALIRNTQATPTLQVQEPPLGENLTVCPGSSANFEVDVLPPGTNISVDSFVWTFPADASILQGEGERVEIFFEDEPGEVCVEIGCPINQTVCWSIEIGQPPSLVPIPLTAEPCSVLTVEDFVEDQNNVEGRLALFASELDALRQANELPATIVNTQGTYWVTKVTSSFCTGSPVQIDVVPLTPSLEVPAQQGACELPYDFSQVPVEELNGFQTSASFFTTFYASEADAENDVNPLDEASDYGTYWIRGEETVQDCYDVVSFELIDANPTFLNLFPRVNCDSFNLAEEITPVTGNNIPAQFISFYENEADAIAAINPLPSTITTSMEVWVRAEIEAGCPGFLTIDITINKTTLVSPEPITFCGDTYNLSNLTIDGADSLGFYSTQADAQNEENPLTDDITGSTTIWVRGENTTTNCSDIIPVELIPADPSIEPIPPVTGCGTPFDLSTVDLLETNGIELTYSYHNSLADAEAGSNPFDGQIETNGTYYIRGAITGPIACYDVATVEVDLIIPDIQQPGPQRLDDGAFDLQNVRVLDLTTLERLSNLSYFADSLDAINENAPISPIVTDVGIYWLRGELNGCSVVVPQEVLAESMASITLPNLPIIPLPCTGDCINLTELSNTDLTVIGIPMTFHFFETESAAEDGFLTDTLPRPEQCDTSIIWVRGTANNGEFGIAQIEIGAIEEVVGTILNEDLAICEENTNRLELELEFTGTAPFEVSYSGDSQDFNITVPSNSFRVPINPTASTTYSLQTIIDAKGCSGVPSGSVNFTVLDQVAVDNIEKTCNDLQTAYTLSFDITKGDLATLFYEGITGEQTGSSFISDPIPVADNYSFIVSDTNRCGPLAPIMGNHICICNSNAPVLNRTPVNACIDEMVIATEAEIGFLAPGDTKYYVLHDSNIDVLGEIFAIQNNPDFNFADNLEIGTTYYLSAVITREDAQGDPILDIAFNPCLSISRGIPVRFFEMPEVSINLGQTTACAGEAVDLLFEMNAAGPFNIILFDGSTTREFTDIQNGHIAQVSANTNTDYIVEYIEFSELESCINEAPENATASLEVIPILSYDNLELTCDANGDEFVISFDIAGGDPATYMVNGSNERIVAGTFTSAPILHQSNYRFELSDSNGCRAIVIQDFGECLCTSDLTTTISVVQDISCPGASDGSIQVVVENGIPPYSFLWQNGATTNQLNDVATGMFSVTMTDQNDCERIDSFFFEGPLPIETEVELNPPFCFGDNNGSIIIKRITGGTQPYNFFFNSGQPTTSQLYGNLRAGNYPLTIMDSRGCEYGDTLRLIDPDPLTVSLNNNPKRIRFGESIEIDARVSHDDVSFTWDFNTPLSCTDCLNPIVQPTEVGIYSLTVSNEFGCTDKDELVVQVLNERNIYAPTAFSPNGDGINDTFGIFGSSQVTAINFLRVYNRWGALLYERSNFGPQVPIEDGWNGLSRNGDEAPAGIYVFKTEIVYLDGTAEIITGDVALLR